MQNPKKVLISAYACRPHQGSEPSIGWNMALSLAAHYPVWVMTRSNNRFAIEAELKSQPISNLHFVFCDTHPLLQKLNTGQCIVHFHYYVWQILAFFTARSLHRQIHFDLVHHVTYVKYWSPSFLAFLPLAFIWGPVGGGESIPPTFLGNMSLRGRVYEFLRNIARSLAHLDPFLYLTARKSSLTLTTTPETSAKVKTLGAKKLLVYSQVGLSRHEVDLLSNNSASVRPPIRFISIGRLLHWKGFHLGLSAFAAAKFTELSEYWIVGDGPERKRLELQADQLEISDKVKFWGNLSRSDIFKKLNQCLALVHPSLHESGGLVCLEAMAAGCPVICLDLGGPGLIVTAQTGVKIPAHDPQQVVKDLAAAMTQIASDSTQWLAMSRAGQIRVEDHYLWETKGEFICQIYQDILDKNLDEIATDRPPGNL